MAKAVALSRKWPYDTPGKFYEVMRQAFTLTGDDRIRLLHERAHMLRVAVETAVPAHYGVARWRREALSASEPGTSSRSWSGAGIAAAEFPSP